MHGVFNKLFQQVTDGSVLRPGIGDSVAGCWLGCLLTLAVTGPFVRAGVMALDHDWQVGAPAEIEVVVPAGLAPLDRSLGLGLSGEKAAEQLWVYRRDLGVTARVVEELQAEFVRTQDRFRQALMEAFGQIPVHRRDVNSVRFRSLQAMFQNENDGFPVSYQIAVAWAYELDDSHFFLPVSLSVFECFVGRAVLPDGAQLPDYLDEVLIVPMVVEGEDGPIEETLEGAALVSGTSVDEVSVVRDRVYRALAGESLLLADYVSRRVQPNAVVDPGLTGRLRERKERLDGLARRLTEGSILVEEGETVSEEHLELLTALKTAMEPALADSRGERPAVRSFWDPFGLLTGPSPANGWVLGSGLALVLALVFWVTAIKGRRRSRLPVMIGDSPDRMGRTEEERAEESVIVRALRDKTVQALYSQHQDFLKHERSATELLREFEARLAALEPGAQAKVRRYEARIKDLEQQLADKEEENRELIRRQIESTRRDIARTMTGATWDSN